MTSGSAPPPAGPYGPPTSPPPGSAVYPPYPPYPYPYYYPPPPRKSQTGLIVLIIILVLVVIPAIFAAVLYVLVGGLVRTPGSAPRPLATLSVASISNGVATVQVAGVSQRLSRDAYVVNLRVNTTTGTPNAIAASGTLSTVDVSGTTYGVTWSDADGDGKISSGDAFTITRSGGLPPATSYVFYLLWYDSTTIATVAFYTP
ncbi:MAG TPA: hypothetical protein VEO20_08925 [Thermoplasmata archaeon]|nr:hypothetical protein [Thermoplasmata archaeon]